MRRVLFLFLMAAVAAPAQEIHQSIDWAKLAAKAVESVDVNLDANLLSLTAKFLSGDKPEEAKLKQAVGNIKGIYVKSLTFEKEGEYSMADVDKIRALLKPPSCLRWSTFRARRAATMPASSCASRATRSGGWWCWPSNRKS